MRHPLLCRGVSQQRKPKVKQGAATKTHCLLTTAGKQGQAFLAKGEQKKITQLWATKVVFPSPWALFMIPNLCNCPRFPQMPQMHRAWQGPWPRERYRRDRCTLLTSWSLGRQKLATWAGKLQKTPGKCMEYHKAVWKEPQQSSLQPGTDYPKSLGLSEPGTTPYLSPPRENWFSLLEPQEHFQVLQPCKVSKAFGCPGKRLSVRTLKQTSKAMWTKSSSGTQLLQAVGMEKPPFAQKWRQKALLVCCLASPS